MISPAITMDAMDKPEAERLMLVTLRVGQQWFGIPVEYVRDVLKGGRIAHVPLAPPDISGSMNLRGRIVTVMDMRRRMHIEITPEKSGSPTFVVVEHKGDYYSLRVDAIGEVVAIPAAGVRPSPSNLPEHWRDLSTGVHQMPGMLLVILDIRALIRMAGNAAG